MKINKQALTESVSDTVVGILINFPLNVAFLYVAAKLELSVIQTSVFLSVVFTVFAVVRKYLLRVYFSKKEQ